MNLRRRILYCVFFFFKGVRRFVILDFGKLIVLIDVVILFCIDLVFLLIDVWV